MNWHPTPWPRLTWPDRFLIEGSVEITYRTPARLEAEVVGRAGQRRYVVHDGLDWRCSCPSWRYRHACAHVLAVSMVAAPPGLRRLKPAPDPQLTITDAEAVLR